MKQSGYNLNVRSNLCRPEGSENLSCLLGARGPALRGQIFHISEYSDYDTIDGLLVMLVDSWVPP